MVAKFIGWPVTFVGGIVLALLGIVLIIVGAASTPTSGTLIFVGIALIIVGALLVLDSLNEREAAKKRRQATA